MLPWVAMTAPVDAAKPEARAVTSETAPAAKPGKAKKKAAKGKSALPQMGQKMPSKDTSRSTQKGPAVAAAALISGANAEDPLKVAARVDEIIQAEMTRSSASAAPRCNDADFLRRVSFDIAGTSPSPQDVTLFGLDPNPNKRQQVVDRLLQTPDYATNWARYWRDVIFMRATETRARLAQKAFETWMTEQIQSNKPWHETVTAMLTATGDVSEVGQTALVYAQRGEPDEVAAETARIFLGIQIQCANCHDHPTDSWKREQFHGLAAFFPRIQVLPKRDSMMRSFEVVSLKEGEGRGGLEKLQENADRLISRLDKNGDKKLSREELRDGPGKGKLMEILFEQGDANKDGLLTAAEIKAVPPLPIKSGRGSIEYHMPDLNDPQSQGKKFDPAFFLGETKPGVGLSDLERRGSLARYVTAPDNVWFARALVNRIWAQLVGEGFYMPIDDIGPERTARHPEALEALSVGFTSSGYDLHWLFRAIANTEAYQRQIRYRDPQQSIPAFASVTPSRLRADQLYDALTRVMGIEDLGRPQRPKAKDMKRYGGGSPRDAFSQVYGIDPSTAPDEINGTLPQALLLMNSPQVSNQLRAKGGTPLAELLTKYSSDDDVLQELFLLVHAREPSAKELQISHDYLKEVNNRQEAFEDLLWSMVNSTEFQTKR